MTDPSMQQQGFVVEHREYHAHSAGTGGHEDVLTVEIKRPTRLDLIVSFSADKQASSWLGRLLRKPDPEVGYQDFDDHVWIKVDAEYEPLLGALLQDAGAREAIALLVALGCKVSLVGGLVSVEAREWDKSKLPSLEETMKYAVALATQVEQFAAGSQA